MLVGGGKPKVPTTTKTLDSYSTTDANVSMTIDGPVNAASEHQQIKITVDKDNVTYEELLGYDGRVTEMRKFDNTINSYEVFLKALSHSGFTKGNSTKAYADEQGYCPLGKRYIFELQDGVETLEHFWATSCGNPKTYYGNTSVTIQLFQAQVPGYDDLSANYDLG